MPFQDAVRVCLRKYATFDGRARRSEYWWFVVFTAVVTTAAAVVDPVIGAAEFRGTGLVQGLATLALVLPGLAVGVRRLHDVGQSGWTLLLIVLPVVGALILIYAFFSRDSEPDNRYGPSPKAAYDVVVG
jgi:uncharacterized membrane protein YhaH (DUF805 family)